MFRRWVRRAKKKCVSQRNRQREQKEKVRRHIQVAGRRRRQEKEKRPGVKSFKSCLRNKQTKRQRPRERESRCFSAPVINIRLMIRL